MKKNNDLDKLFRDKLQNLKVSPPEGTWEAIAEKLPSEKKRRPVVLWWWSAAAVFLILFSAGAFYWLNGEDNSTIQIVETENTTKPSTKANQNNIIAVESDSKHEPSKQLITNEDLDVETIRSTSNDKVVADASSQKTIQSSKDNSINRARINNSTEPKLGLDNKSGTDSDSKTKIAKSEQIDINEEQELDTSTNKNTQIAVNEQEVEDEATESKTQPEVTSLVEDNTLFAEENRSDKSDAKNSKWSVGPQVAPVYYNSMSGGSSLDQQFDNSSKNGGLNMSLGVQVAYEINDNWKVRSGINRMNVGYATNNVQVGYSDPNLAINSIHYNGANVDGGVVVTAFSNDNLSSIESSEFSNRVQILSLEGNTQLKQNITYLEVPIEIERKIIESNFEWSIIGGVSSLFLTDDDIHLSNKEEGYNYSIGTANNLEKASFTTNIGMGFGYKFSKSINLQLEPMFKYQLNAYKNGVGFKPYIFGVYTGINWKLD